MTSITDRQNGLNPVEVEASRRENGANTLTRRKKRGFFRQFLSSFGDPIIKVLLAALAVNVIFLFRHFDWFESLGIAIAIFLATFVSTLSEYGSESAFAKLQEDAGKIQCRVRRSGMIVSLPDRGYRGGRYRAFAGGGAHPGGWHPAVRPPRRGSVRPQWGKRGSRQIPGGDTLGDPMSGHSLFRGTIVCSGDGEMLVTRVGDSTFYGSLAQEVQEETRESPLKLRLSRTGQNPQPYRLCCCDSGGGCRPVSLLLSG